MREGGRAVRVERDGWWGCSCGSAGSAGGGARGARGGDGEAVERGARGVLGRREDGRVGAGEAARGARGLGRGRRGAVVHEEPRGRGPGRVRDDRRARRAAVGADHRRLVLDAPAGVWRCMCGRRTAHQTAVSHGAAVHRSFLPSVCAGGFSFPTSLSLSISKGIASRLSVCFVFSVALLPLFPFFFAFLYANLFFLFFVLTGGCFFVVVFALFHTSLSLFCVCVA